MAMQAASLQVLEKANVPAPQALAIVQAIEIEIAGAQNILATKQDITQLREDTKAEFVQVCKEISRLEVKISESARDLTRHMYAAIGVQMGLLLGIAYFFVTHLKV
jgi:hypothetical protein